ncbi:diguanylate cyclase domain-containing protein [Rhizobium puerariae]|uniref:Diguanylate cyclase domain-containing protein n=1 Tax=Rhizobium puerariae TaxID=1585791 RepID=A0ABV6AHA9_9HYPH
MAFLEGCPMAVLILDAGGVVAFANAEGRGLFQPRPELLGHQACEILSEWPLAPGVSHSVVLDDGAGGGRACLARVVTWTAAAGVMTAVLLEPEDEETSAGKAAREASLRLRYVIEMLPQAVCVFDSKDRYILWNRKYAELYSDIADYLTPGIPFEEILKISLAGGGIPEIVSDRDAWLRVRMRKFRQPSSQEEQHLRDGRWMRYDDRRTPDGGAIGMRIDITDLKQREEWLRQLFDANPMPMLLCDGDSLAILDANLAALNFYGFDRTALLSKSASGMHAAGEAEGFAARLRNLEADCEARTVWRQHMADGRERHVLIYVRFLYEGPDRRLLLTVADVSDRVLAEAEANRLAHHDALTGLPNRMQFYKALAAASNPGSAARVVAYCLDLDGFKPVNDTFGHAAGDEVLKMVAVRLRSEAKGHMVARLGGDEFAILLPAATDVDTRLAQRCIAAFEVPFVIRGLPITLGVSIGIASAPADGLDGEALVQAADRALYQAKAAGRNTWRLASAERRAPELAKAR